MMEKPKKVSEEASELVNEIKEKKKDLGDLQDSCRHPNSSLKNVGPENDTLFDLCKVCDDCHKNLGKATKDELEKWLEN